MNAHELLILLRMKVRQKIGEKTGWGKNELALAIEEVFAETLAEVLDDRAERFLKSERKC